MHQGNREWLAYVQQTYGGYWKTSGVLELGAYNINGSAREYLISDVYVGVDQMAGPGVDIAMDAEKIDLGDRSFGCLVSVSMFEHTSRWREILDHNIQWSAPSGFVILSWGAEGNQPHEPFPWAAIPVGDVLEWAMQHKLDVLEAHWERSRFTADCPGCYDFIARRRA